MRRSLLASILFLLAAGNSTFSQEQPPVSTNAAPASATNSGATQKARPKVGVALEGGGALGLAHIGVLQWFEDHHIPVDYIAGTSMGGLVGGFYATGKSRLSKRRTGT